MPKFGKYNKADSSANPVRYFYEDGIYKQKNVNTSNTARIMCAGDMMCEPVMSKAVFYNNKFMFETCFSKIKKVFNESDFAIANLETSVDENSPYAIDTHKLEDRYHCNAPVEYLDAIRYAGIDALTTANNHSADTGATGIKNTINNLDAYGFMHTGSFVASNDKRYILVDINGIKVAFLSYTQHINSSLDEKCFTAEGRDVMLNLYSKDKVKRDAHDAKKEGAEFIICYIHFWCKDYVHDEAESQITCAKEIAEMDVDCIVGGHPHAVQKYDVIVNSAGKRVPVTYCLGNFITSDSNMITRTNYIYELFLKKNAEGKVVIEDEKYIPCRVVESLESSSYVVFPTPKGWRNGRDNDFLKNAENEIQKYVGNKIKIDYNE